MSSLPNIVKRPLKMAIQPVPWWVLLENVPSESDFLHQWLRNPGTHLHLKSPKWFIKLLYLTLKTKIFLFIIYSNFV